MLLKLPDGRIAQTFTEYAKALRAFEVALSLKWITRLRFTDGQWLVEYIGRCA